MSFYCLNSALLLLELLKQAPQRSPFLTPSILHGAFLTLAESSFVL
jgi:hypothetical protein